MGGGHEFERNRSPTAFHFNKERINNYCILFTEQSLSLRHFLPIYHLSLEIATLPVLFNQRIH